MTRAQFVLKAAADAGIKIGTDGTDLILAIPPRLPSEVRRSFEQAIAQHEREIIALILAENEQ
jgi:hypothetical protein